MALYKIVFRIRRVVQQLLEICLVCVPVFHCPDSLHTKTSRMVLDLPHVPVRFSRNGVHKDSTSVGLIKEFFADLCNMRNHSETFRPTSPTRQTVRESLPRRVRCQIWKLGCNLHSRCCVHDVQNGQRLFFFLLLRSFNFQKFTAIETTSLSVSE